MIFARVARVIIWCGNTTIMVLFGCFANDAIGGISVTPDYQST